jgi:NAD(P)-dependent dehydrogenase (short-subunit alcohol dehydrogenase family)
MKQELDAAMKVLQQLADDPSLLAQLSSATRRELLEAAGRISRPARDERRKLQKALRRKDKREVREADAQVLDRTGIRQLRRAPVFRNALPEAAERPALAEARKCYVCKAEFREVHAFYDQMCPPCAELNFAKRNQSADLRGRTALVTGGRVKIGYQTALKLLQAGARVIVTTRFPQDAARRYAAEPDCATFDDRLRIYGLDLRHTPSVERFCAHLAGEESRLDYLISNACQTVRRPVGFYAHLLEAAAPTANERKLLAGDASPVFLPLDRELPEHRALFPAGVLDQDLQQVDLRDRNSWRLPLAEVSTVELLEVHLVNAIAPFVLAARLKPLLLADRRASRHVVNVSAMEGQFYRAFKTDKHPHTNMAKAALNMLTRTSAADYAKDDIFMHAVDTGWVTDEDPEVIAARKTAVHGFHPPLDIVDGAARVLDPVFADIREAGLFWKDYRPVDW